LRRSAPGSCPLDRGERSSSPRQGTVPSSPGRTARSKEASPLSPLLSPRPDDTKIDVRPQQRSILLNRLAFTWVERFRTGSHPSPRRCRVNDIAKPTEARGRPSRLRGLAIPEPSTSRSDPTDQTHGQRSRRPQVTPSRCPLRSSPAGEQR
jgi:hypothetical protein